MTCVAACMDRRNGRPLRLVVHSHSDIKPTHTLARGSGQLQDERTMATESA